MVKLFKKNKVTPEELETKLSLAEKKLTKREETIKDRRNKARNDAKEALKNGDERTFKVASRKYGGLSSQLATLDGMIEMSVTMKDAVQQQKDLEEIVAIGGDLVEAQELLGFDTQKVQDAITGIRSAVDKVTTASEMITTQTELMTSASPEATREQESLKSELMAELKSEGSETTELEEKIKEMEEA